jgi:ATP-dependent RNA helicase HelY
VPAAGRLLARIYAEQDLLAAECLRAGIWDDLRPPALAAAVSTLVFEPRGEERSAPRLPDVPHLLAALDATEEVYDRLRQVENLHQLSFVRPPELGFVQIAHDWASGRSLERVLTDAGPDFTAGDFVRWMRQLVDLLDQLAEIAPEDSPVRSTARAALRAVRRGVVDYALAGADV